MRLKKILLIEDDTVLRENTAELLELSNYEVRTAANGKKGVQLAMEYLPDVIVCDIMMPELDGYGVLETLAEKNGTKRIPFIFLSAKTERKDVRKGMELGADDYLTKPFEEAELLGAIESRLAKMAILKEESAGKTRSEKSSHAWPKTIYDLKNHINDHGKEYGFGAGESIYREGMYSTTFYLVLKGIVKTHKLDSNGKELITGIYRPDDFFGFICFTGPTTPTEYATAMETTKLVGITTKEVKHLLERNHDLTMELMQFLSGNLSKTKEQLLEMAYGSVHRKTASTLLKFTEKLQKDPKGNLHVLRSDLAGVAGVATETLIRTLSSFKKEGLIQIEGRNLRIVDVDRLRRVD